MGKGFSMHAPSVHQHADRVGERGGQISRAGAGASGSALHGSALGAIGESTTGAHQQMVSTLQGAVGNAGGALRNQSGLLRQTAQNTTDTDSEHAGRLGRIRPDGETPSARPTGRVGGMPNRGHDVVEVAPRRYRTDSSGRRTRFDVYPRSDGRYRIDSSGRRTRFDVHPAPQPRRVPASERPYPGYVTPPPGSMVSSATFRRPDGSFDYAREGEFMRRNYPNVRHVNPGYHRNERGTWENCGPASMTTNRVIMTGRPRLAPRTGVTDQYRMEAAESSRFRPVTHYGEIPDRIRTDPHGRNQGTLFMSRNPRVVGHYISVHRDDRGRTVFIDGQSNRVGHLDPNAGVMDYMPANELNAPEWRRPYQ